VYGGTLEAEAASRGQLVIMRMKRRQMILSGCCTHCMLYLLYAYLVYAVLVVCCTWCMLYSVSTKDYGMERWRGLTLLCILR